MPAFWKSPRPQPVPDAVDRSASNSFAKIDLELPTEQRASDI